MNGGRPPFNDPLVRQAVYHAIDVDAMVNDIMGGTVERATSYINANVWGFAAQTPYPYDPDRAREILAEAGLADGVDMELKWTPRDVKAKELVEFSIAQLEEVGIRGKSIEQEHTVWLEDLLALDWDVQLVSGATSTGDADYTLRRIYFSGNNRTGWVNEAYDDLVTQAARTTDLAERKELYAQAQKIAWDDGPNVMLFEDIATYGLNARVQGFEPWPDEPPRFADMWVSG
jgi:peptide/nickel transport system substrate-binding protein